MRERGGEADQGEGGAKTSQIALKPPSPRLDAARRTGMHLEELSLTLRAAAHLPPDDDEGINSGPFQYCTKQHSSLVVLLCVTETEMP